ncbi:chromate efflux transporter [Massilia sp. Root335]|uniref:chromate efflux transporter n=1 Tax=Massilia sp. Root335 TaxID=1736517 RepID=UPI0006FA43F1|nr:chromate efflux transporter [Massilia sp. Root335]KQV40217.1 chromate transporter [Massilia sp. Root335]
MRDEAGPPSLASLCALFLRVGCSSFGGYMSMVSVMQNAVVAQRKLLTDQDVLDGVTLASILPGPVAINTVAYVGYRLRGAMGACVCVCAAVLPAFVFMVVLASLYFRWGRLPQIDRLFMGIMPAVAAVVLGAAWRMCRVSVRGWREALLAGAAVVLLLCCSGLLVTPAIVVASALVGRFWFREDGGAYAPAPRQQARGNAGILFATPLVLVPLVGAQAALLAKLLAAFAGMSLLMFGGGYVSIPVLQHTVVDGYGWVTGREFADAMAMTQLTPGPVLIGAAFIGLKVAGIAGAVAATVGVFTPTAVLMVGCAHRLNRWYASGAVRAALRGVRAAGAGMVVAAAFAIGKMAAPVWLSPVLFVLALLLLLRWRVEAFWVVPLCGAIGYFLF